MMSRSLIGRYAFIFVVFLAGVCTSTASALYYQRNWQASVVESFHEAAAERINTIEQLLAYNEIALKSVHAFYQSSSYVSHDEFVTFTTFLLKNTPFLRAIEWLPRVLPENRDTYERAAQAWQPGFSLGRASTPAESENDVTPTESFPIYYVAPAAGDELVLGRDVARDFERGAALEVSRRTRDVRASGLVSLWLPTRTSDRRGVFFVLPVYKTHEEGNATKERLDGFVVTVISLYELIEAALKPLQLSGINLLLHDLDAEAPDKKLLFVRSTRLKDIPVDDIVADFRRGTQLSSNRHFEVGGRRWQVTALAARGFYLSNPSAEFYAILTGGILSSFLLTAFLLVLTRRAETVQREVQEKTLSLRQLMEQLTRSNTELERFAYVASHDMQEPIRMISNFGRLLAEEYGGKLGEEAGQYLQFMTEAAVRLQSMVEDLLEYARMEHNATRLVAVDMNALVKDVTTSLSLAIAENGAEVICAPLPGVSGNPVQISRLVQNLFANALRYRREDTPPQIRIGVKDEGVMWRFEVADNGAGIAAEYVNQIFEPFRRLHTWQHSKGTGMGLAICKTIVDNHGGKIWVTSQPGKGSVFHFTLPKKTTENA